LSLFPHHNRRRYSFQAFGGMLGFDWHLPPAA
jgi:hypothetical protein